MRIGYAFFIGLSLFASTARADRKDTQETDAQAPVRVAFVGDQGLTDGTRAVLKMIKDEKADLLVIPGDFDYQHNPKGWANLLDETVGNMPIFGVIGNHDVLKWSEYQKILSERLGKIPDAHCSGEVGIKQDCLFRGLNFVLSGIGTKGKNHEEFLQASLKSHQNPFKICVWHKNQKRMQVGDKQNEVGWEAYETCRKEGAIIITGHEHSYERTYLLSNFEKQTIEAKDSVVQLEPGKSFAVVSGLGGKSIREESGEGSWWDEIVDAFQKDKFNPAKGEWWAKIYTADQGANFGALFCDFFKGNSPREASCYFKNIEGAIVDEFTILSKVGETTTRAAADRSGANAIKGS